MDKQGEQQRKVINEKYKDELLHKLDELRKANFKCDTTIRAEGQDFAAHSVVLSAASDYFRALFASELQVKEKQNSLVELKDIKETTLVEVLKFIYSGEANISSSNAQELVVASDYLTIPSLKSSVAQFLGESLNVSNCFALESFASQNNCDSLRQAAIKYECQHFVAAVKSEDFLSLGFDQVKELMCKDELNIAEEEEVYEAVIAWVKHDLSSRECFLPDLLKCLRLFSMSKYSIRKILNTEELVGKSLICTNIMNSGLDFFLFPDRFLGNMLKHRNSIENEEYVVVLTGGYDSFSDHVYFSGENSCFVLATKEWHSLCPMPSPVAQEIPVGSIYASLCGGRLYVMFDYHLTKKVSCFNPQKNTWKLKETVFPSQIAAGFTVTSFNENLYIIGGYLNSEIEGVEGVVNETHKYNPIRNEWKQLASMATERATHCAVVLEDLIYVIGGSDHHTALKSVECYDPSTNQWRQAPDLTNARRNFSAATVCEKIVVIGGYFGIGEATTMEPTCELFDPCLNQWSLVSSPKVPRTACGIVSVDDIVYVFGGENEEESILDSMECFDAKRNEWHEVDATMPIALSFVEATFLKLPKKFISRLNEL